MASRKTSTNVRTKRKGKAKKSRRAPLTAHQVTKRKFEKAMKAFFERVDFRLIKSDGVEFTFKNRTGEIDALFVHENIVIVAEYTVGQPDSGHVGKKALLWGLIRNHAEDWIEHLRETYPEFASHFDKNPYEASDYRVKICYLSKNAVSDEIESILSDVTFIDETRFRYFDALAKTIHKSARFELFKFLDLEFKEVGREVLDTSNRAKKFVGHLLPENFSSFPKGFKVVSFYADPGTLLTMAYVLRRDSWRDADATYQRVLMKGRMTEMRRYLTTQKRVFVNNIIVTLPSDTALNDLTSSQKNLSEDAQKQVRPVTVGVPFRSNTMGIVDGQHRIFCYHEGTDNYEGGIKKLRSRQNLLVTGVIYPEHYSDSEKQRFEARLFLEINDKQKKAKSELKQSIELILNPYSNTSIAKQVIQRLNVGGALRGMLQTNYFDPPSYIRTTSIVSYGLRPLVRLDEVATLFAAWGEAGKSELLAAQKSGAVSAATDALLEKYVDFCVVSINDLLIAARKNMPSKWRLAEKPKDRQLSPTLINGLLLCMRLLIERKRLYAAQTYETKLGAIDTFPFSRYRSSSWAALGEKLYAEYFA